MTFIPTIYKDLHIPSFFLGNRMLKVKREHKYLGALLTDSGTDDTDINRQMRSVYIQGNIIIQKFAMCTDDVKVQLLRTYCYNMYGCQLWSKFSKQTFDKLRVAYNNIFRIFMSIDRRTSVSEAFIQRNVHHFNVLYRKLIYNFRSRLFNTDNVILRAIVCSPFFIYGSQLNSRWKDILYTHVQ
jgi:hypothetical protein